MENQSINGAHDKCLLNWIRIKYYKNMQRIYRLLMILLNAFVWVSDKGK